MESGFDLRVEKFSDAWDTPIWESPEREPLRHSEECKVKISKDS